VFGPADIKKPGSAQGRPLVIHNHRYEGTQAVPRSK
jgi:hypothetical protein